MRLYFYSFLPAALLFYLPLALPTFLISENEISRNERTVDSQIQREIRVVPVHRTPEPKTIILAVQVPKMGQTVGGNPVWVQTRIDGYTLGSNSQFDRAYEVANADIGQSMHIIIDDHPYFPIYSPCIDPFSEQGWYYDQSFKFEVPFKLSPGVHTIRVLLTRSYGESLKGDNVYFASYFFVGSQTDRSKAMILTEPYLTYNEPGPKSRLVESKPVLVDFYLSNAELSEDGYKVKMTIDGKTERTLTSWQPYYIYGLKKGKHTLRLQLIDGKNRQVPGAFNDVQESFTIQ